MWVIAGFSTGFTPKKLCYFRYYPGVGTLKLHYGITVVHMTNGCNDISDNTYNNENNMTTFSFCFMGITQLPIFCKNYPRYQSVSWSRRFTRRFYKPVSQSSQKRLKTFDILWTHLSPENIFDEKTQIRRKFNQWRKNRANKLKWETWSSMSAWHKVWRHETVVASSSHETS